MVILKKWIKNPQWSKIFISYWMLNHFLSDILRHNDVKYANPKNHLKIKKTDCVSEVEEHI